MTNRMTPLLGLLAACLGTEMGNPPFSAGLTIDTHSSDPSVASIDVDDGGVVITEAWLVFGSVAFADNDTCEQTPSPVTALTTADHATGGHLNAMFSLTSRRFCRVQAQFDLATSPLPAGAPPELEQASIVLVGAAPNGTEFTLVSAAAQTVSLDALDGTISLVGDEPGLFLGFDVATWFSGLDIDSATVGMDGRIRIDGTSNAGLLMGFEANLAGGLELFPDDDLNGMPDGAPVARGAP